MKVLACIAVLLAVGVTAGCGATWIALPGVPPSVSQSLVSCVALAQPEDTIILLPGYHEGPVLISKSLCILADTPGESTVWAFSQPMVVTSSRAVLKEFTILSERGRAPEHAVLEINGTEAYLEGIVIIGRGAMGTGLRVTGNSHVALSGCDFTNSPRDYLIRLVSCPNNVFTADCTWPYTQMSVLDRVIWDKIDDPTLGIVVY